MIDWFCTVLAEFSAERQEAFDNAWSEGDPKQMEKLIEEHLREYARKNGLRGPRYIT